jgi:hypothetical protein
MNQALCLSALKIYFGSLMVLFPHGTPICSHDDGKQTVSFLSSPERGQAVVMATCLLFSSTALINHS